MTNIFSVIGVMLTVTVVVDLFIQVILKQKVGFWEVGESHGVGSHGGESHGGKSHGGESHGSISYGNSSHGGGCQLIGPVIIWSNSENVSELEQKFNFFVLAFW